MLRNVHKIHVEEFHELFVLEASLGAGVAAIFLEDRDEAPSLDFTDTCDKYARAVLAIHIND